jgi:hypothetical protein
MWQDATQREMAERLARLTPDAAAQWGRMTPARMVAHVTQSFRSAADVARLQDVMQRFAAKDPKSAFPEHAAFGRLSGAQWGVLMYRHTDHHFRQFGVQPP